MRFKDIIGHEEAKARLRKMVSDNQLPHALLFSGSEGIGKLALARAFAQYLHCTNRTPDGDSCGKCPSCIQHENDNFPDLLYVFPTAGSKQGKANTVEDLLPQWYEFIHNYPLAPYEKWLNLMNADNAQPLIKTDEAKEIIIKMNLSNYAAEQKVMILWLPEKLQPSAANRLLKQIEEPAKGNIFLMVSNNPEDILPTIYSRLQRIELTAPSRQLIADYLTRDKGVYPQMANILAINCEGNLQKALNMLELDGEHAEFLKYFQELMRTAYRADVTGLKKWSDDVTAFKREKIRRFLTYCTRMIRENFLYNFHNGELLSLNPQEENFSRNFAPFIHEGNVAQMMNELDMANRDIAGNGNSKIVLFDFALQMIILLKTIKPN
jgi:DNA polymerase-3 subunit delta'